MIQVCHIMIQVCHNYKRWSGKNYLREICIMKRVLYKNEWTWFNSAGFVTASDALKTGCDDEGKCTFFWMEQKLMINGDDADDSQVNFNECDSEVEDETVAGTQHKCLGHVLNYVPRPSKKALSGSCLYFFFSHLLPFLLSFLHSSSFSLPFFLLYPSVLLFRSFSGFLTRCFLLSIETGCLVKESFRKIDSLFVDSRAI